HIKSFNKFWNKRLADAKSFIGVGTSKRQDKLNFKRMNWMQNKMHHISRFVVNYCIEHNIGKIIIGKNDGWKQEINLGSKTNQSFVQIPMAKLIDMITYKAELVGIGVELTEESYTSKIDHFAFEEMKHQVKYLGKRVRRGLFQSSVGKLLNADVNGAIGIARKVVGDSFVEKILGRGFVCNPFRLTI
ncbi:MAG: IS200/IS605 family accessory protein TnpB-related protein, partial [Firmicutes bacterium]|nr:IS200/IS605 family accessory protein TnpB-related protein [Bacillota bacterium]